MALHFDLVSPERLLLSGEVDQVDLPGSEGDLGVLAGHAPMVTASGAAGCRGTARSRSRWLAFPSRNWYDLVTIPSGL